MGKHIQRSYELKKQIIEERLEGKHYVVLCKKYDELHGTVALGKRSIYKEPQPMIIVDVTIKMWPILRY